MTIPFEHAMGIVAGVRLSVPPVALNSLIPLWCRATNEILGAGTRLESWAVQDCGNPDLYERNRGRSKIDRGIIPEALIGAIRLRVTRTRR